MPDEDDQVHTWRIDCENQRYTATLILLKGYKDSKSAARNMQVLKKSYKLIYFNLCIVKANEETDKSFILSPHSFYVKESTIMKTSQHTCKIYILLYIL